VVEGDLTSRRELMSRVACDPNRQRPVGAPAELAIDTPIGLQSHNDLRRVEPARRAHSRHEVRVAGHEDDRVAQVSADEFEQPGADRHVCLLLLPSDERAAAQWARLALGFEVAEPELQAGGLECSEVLDLPCDRSRMPGFSMVGHCREVHDRRDGAAAGESMKIRPTQACNVQPAE